MTCQMGIRNWINMHEAPFAALARDIWTHPELPFEEHHAVCALIAPLSDAGFQVDVGVYGLLTAELQLSQRHPHLVQADSLAYFAQLLVQQSVSARGVPEGHLTAFSYS